MRFASHLLLLTSIALVTAYVAVANPEPPKSGYNPPLATASDEAAKAIARFQHDPSLKIDVWAAEPMMAHPVAFAFDEKGRCYVAETFRLSHGTTDTRGHMNWLDEDLASRTVADRIAKYKKDAKEKFAQTYEKDRERVRLLEDTTGSGRADKSTVFRDDFGRAEDGLGAGLLARNGTVYYTCIPDLWLLKDTKGTGTADVKQSLATGYGVHTAFIGHDLHGLRMGPDGKLYFSIGDRGLNVTAKDGTKLFNPDSGAVIRCDLDGGHPEIVATGLRNPQELAFDDYGNLFTCDNNSDSGDQARFVHIVEGGDSGWRIGYQYGSEMHDSSVKQGNRGPWNYEQLWKPHGENQAAYVLPPLRNFADGPSGFTHYPGVGLAVKYQGYFFLCDFRGSPAGSGVWAFTTQPKGASFEMADPHHFVWNILATDCEFGPDSAFYVSDWIDGWDLTGKGRLYKVADPVAARAPAVAEAKELIAAGFASRPTDELVKLLAHPHQRVRQEAQFALAEKGKNAIAPLAGVANKHPNRLARLHAIWGLGMIGRTDATAFESVVSLLSDADLEVRANAAKVYGEHSAAVADKLIPLLHDTEPRVRLLAGLALARGKMNEADAMAIRAAAFALLEENVDKDPYLRHAGASALAARVPSQLIAEGIKETTVAVRLACVVALRKQRAAEVAAFLTDTDPKVVAEAARAVNDADISAALPKLAELSAKADLPEVVAFRVLNAHFRLGKAENARAIAAYAARPGAPEAIRALAVKMLGDWPTPTRRDYVTGLTQKLDSRPQAEAVTALTAVLGNVFAAPDIVRKSATAAAAKLGLKEVGPFLVSLVRDDQAPTASRVDALKALEALKDGRLAEVAATAIASTDPRLRTAGRAVLIKQDRAGVIKQLAGVLAGSNVAEQQGAFELLAATQSPEADALLEEWLDKVAAKSAPPELMLDILEATAATKSERLKRRLRAVEAARPKGDDIANYREALAGGDAVRGRDLFLNKTAVQCQRCHKLDGQGGEVGPPLNGLGKQPREYLLESIVLPNKAIAKGFDSVLITTLDGKSVSGVLRSEDANEVKLITAEGQPLVVKKADIDDRKATKSAMPEDLPTKLTKREIRDLVEFLSSLKDEAKK